MSIKEEARKILTEDPKIAVERFKKIQAEAEQLCLEWTEYAEKKKIEGVVFLTAVEMMGRAKEKMQEQAQKIVDADPNLRIQISEQANAMTRELMKGDKKK